MFWNRLVWMLVWAKMGYAQIYDCFLFYNELDVLEIRLEELGPYVDYFVLVESTETFRGVKKPLYFLDNRARYQKFLDQIIHIIVEEEVVTDDPFIRETFQRNQIMQGLKGCQAKDDIIISDVDEIIKGSRLSTFLQPIQSRGHWGVPLLPDFAPFLKGVCRTGAVQQMFYYQLNRYNPNWTSWVGSSATKYEFLVTVSPQWIREHRFDPPLIEQMGWHFTWMGGAKHVYEKAFATSHDGYSNDERFISAGSFEMWYRSFPVMSVDEERFPRFVVEHQEELRRKGLLD